MTKALVSGGRLERAIAWLSPGHALKRAKARGEYNALSGGGYDGARRDRRDLQAFNPSGTSADAASLPDLETLRARSRDLARNAPFAGGALRTNVTNVVGAGLRLRPRIDREALKLSDDAADRWERQALREFNAWADSPECDVSRTLTFGGLQGLSFRSELENGDSFTFLPYLPRPGSAYGLKLQLVEADRISNPNRRQDSEACAGGIQLEHGTGAPLGYWATNRHPGAHITGGAALTWTYHAAFGERSGRRNVLHHFVPERIGQTRGIPYFAPVVALLKQLTRYGDAELMAAVMTASVAVVSKIEAGSGTARSPLAATSSETPEASDLARVDIDFEAGLVIEGFRPNESIEGFTTSRPNPQFEAFVQAVVRQLGVALELPYEVLIKHFTASYSAARAALLEAWRVFRVRRAHVASSFCQPVYEAFLTEAVAIGRLKAPGFFADPMILKAWAGAQWIGPSPGQIDPEKEARANEIAVDRAWKTDDQVTAETTGEDWEVNVKVRGREVRQREAEGLAPPPPKASAPAPEPKPNPDKKDEEKE